MTQMKLMIVEWIDSGSSASWATLRGLILDEPLKCRSIGWVIRETDEFVHLVPNLSVEKDPEDWRNGEGFGGIVIPQVNIISMQEVV